MKISEYAGFILEQSEANCATPYWYAWFSDRQRNVIGYGKALTRGQAISDALIEGAGKGKRAAHAAEQMSIDVFGTAGFAATSANANSGQ